MTLRDIQVLTELIKIRIGNGLDLNSSVCSDFQKEIKHKNYLFSSGVDFIYEFFNFERRFKNQLLSNSIKFLGKNKIFNRTIKKFADIGMKI